MLPRRKQGQNILYKSKNRRFTTVISHINSNKSNKLNASNSDNSIGTSNLPHSNVQNDSLLNTLITLQKLIEIKSISSMNDEKIIKQYEQRNFISS